MIKITREKLLQFAKSGPISVARAIATVDSLKAGEDYQILNYGMQVVFEQERKQSLELVVEQILNDEMRLHWSSVPTRIKLLGEVFNIEALMNYIIHYDDNSQCTDCDCGSQELEIDGEACFSDEFIKRFIQTELKVKTVTSIMFNEEKRITTVVFTDGDVQMSKCSKEDDYDPYVGVAICIAAHEFGSKTKFKKFVDKTMKVKNNRKGTKKK